MITERVRAEDVKPGDLVLYCGRARHVRSVWLGAVVGLELVDRSTLAVGRGSVVEVVAGEDTE